MYERLENCPVCKSENFKNFLIVKDYTVSQESFVIVQCDECDFKFTNPRPTKKEIGKYYKSEDYISHSNKSNNLISKVYQIVRYKTLNDKLSLINKLHEKGALLDIGCGTGHFLAVCQKAGWKIKGIEPDEQANQIAHSKTGISIGTDFLKEKYDQKFDVITMWHVLEHVHDLEEYIQKLNNVLSATGKLVIAVPNSESLDASIYRESWAAYDVPRHLYHFTSSTIQKLLARHGFKLLDKQGMYFDAYYVSMLSEKYKKDRGNLLKAVKQGFESNSYAKRENNYSSMIYILEK
jgi:2-polyprenyl-3-methyl-5-hydroxy-6-metoxy-1,4-benzoquinol methylase